MYLDWVKVVQLRILETSLLAVRVGIVILVWECAHGECGPGPIKCFSASQHQILAKSASQKARNRDNALFTTNMRKSRINYVNVNHEQ